MTFLLIILSLITTLFCSVVYLRFAAQLCGADFRNPLSQALIQVTNPPLIILRRYIPGWKGKDTASIVLFLSIVLIEALITAFIMGSSYNPILLTLGLISRSLFIILNTYFFGLILVAIVSWVAPNPYSPVNLFFGPILAPLLRPIQRHIKPIGGAIDLSPVILIFITYLLKIGIIEMFVRLAQLLISSPLASGDVQFFRYMIGSANFF